MINVKIRRDKKWSTRLSLMKIMIRTIIRLLYGIVSILAIITGMGLYVLFRDMDNMILMRLLPGLQHAVEGPPLKANPSVLTNMALYNVPDMLWFLSGILALRCIWFNNQSIQKVYTGCFYGIGVLIEITQISKEIPGTFDWMDLLCMSIGALVEVLLYYYVVWQSGKGRFTVVKQVKRRLV